MNRNRVRRFEGVPGVEYPTKKRDAVLAEVPEGYISTAKAAEMLGCSTSNARLALANNEVEGVLVKIDSRTSLYWPEHSVEVLKAYRLVQEAIRFYLKKGGKA